MIVKFFFKKFNNDLEHPNEKYFKCHVYINYSKCISQFYNKIHSNKFKNRDVYKIQIQCL
jgi:hypothetical protein